MRKIAPTAAFVVLTALTALGQGNQVLNLGSYTADTNPFNLTWTTDNSSTTFTGLKWVATNTLQHSGSFNYQFCGGASGTTCLQLDTSANMTTPGSVTGASFNSTGSNPIISLSEGAAPTSLPTTSVSLYPATSITTSYALELPSSAPTATFAPVLAGAATGTPLLAPLSFGTLSNMSGTELQTASGSLTSGNIGEFNSSGDLTDASIAATNLPLLNAANSFTATNTFDNIKLNNLVATYNGLTTAGLGVPPIIGTPLNSTGNTGNLATNILYTTLASGAGSAGTYRVCLTAYVTAIGSATAIVPNVVYNNGNAVVRALPTLSAAALANVSDGCVTLYSLASKNIGVDTTGYSGTGTFAVRATIEQLQ